MAKLIVNICSPIILQIKIKGFIIFLINKTVTTMFTSTQYVHCMMSVWNRSIQHTFLSQDIPEEKNH